MEKQQQPRSHTAIFSPGRIKAVVVNSLWRSRLPNTGTYIDTDAEHTVAKLAVMILKAYDEEHRQA